jgi:tetratricopeptide (TPR) repeat protein
MRERLYNIICIALVAVALVTSTVLAHAADSKTTARASWKAGIEAYNAKEYAEAVEAFETVVANDYASAEVYYNLANAYFKLGQQESSSRPFAEGELGRAVLNYERALKLDPTMDDARYNLDIAKDHTNDTEAVPESFIVRVWHSMAGAMTTNGWATLSLIMLGVAIVLALLYLLHASIVVRKVAFFAGIIVVIIFVLSTALSITQREAAVQDMRAVILAFDTIPVHASPDSSSKIIREPSQGVTVEIERTQGEWSEVRFADGEKGWVRSVNVEII